MTEKARIKTITQTKNRRNEKPWRRRLQARKEEIVFRATVRFALDHSYQFHVRSWERMSPCIQVLSRGNNEFVSLRWKRNAVVWFSINPPLTDVYIIEQLRYGVEKSFLRIKVATSSFLRHIILPESADFMNGLLQQWFLTLIVLMWRIGWTH